MKNVIILAFAIAALAAAQPALVTVGGTVFNSDGTGFTGKLTISNASLVCSDVPLPASSRDYSVLSGVVSPTIQLFPLADCTPGYSYTVIYQGKERSTVYWDIHASPTSTTIGVVQRQAPVAPSMTVRWGQLTNVPSLFTPSSHASTHLSSGVDPIAAATALVRGTVTTTTSTSQAVSTDDIRVTGAVVGAATLTHAGVIPLVSAVGAIGESALKDDGTTVSVIGRNLSVGQMLSAASATLTTSLAPASGGVGGMLSVPLQFRFLGDGSDGAIVCNNTTLIGVKFATSFTVAAGQTCGASQANVPLAIYATGACTIAGTINARGIDGGTSTLGGGDGGGSGGGGGGGATAGVAGTNSTIYWSFNVPGGAAGSSSGGVGGAGMAFNSLTSQRNSLLWARGGYLGGARGGAGGSAGGGQGGGGQALVLVCASINFTGTIDVSGAPGANAPGNSTGAGGGGGGGYVWLIGRDSVINTGTIVVAGGVGGSCLSFTTCGAGGVGGAGWSKVAVMQ